MATTNVQITTDWGEAHGTAEEIDVSCNSQDWFMANAASTPAASFEGRKIKETKIINVVIPAGENLYARATKNNGVLAID